MYIRRRLGRPSLGGMECISKLRWTVTALLILRVSGCTVDYYNYDGTADCPEEITACQPPWIINGRATYGGDGEKENYDPGDRIQITCNEGFELSGEAELECLANFAWSGESACNVKPPERPRCRALPVLDNSMEVVPNSEVSEDGVYSKVRVQCRGGDDYLMNGDEEHTCEGTEWKGRTWCIRRALCPALLKPRHGQIFYNGGRSPGSSIVFDCDEGYYLIGQDTWRCLPSLRWDAFNVYCKKDEGIADVATDIQENFIDKYEEASASSPGRGRLAIRDPHGIDLFFLIDRSSSIASEDFQVALKFIKLFVDVFGISSRGGATRLSVISFGNQAKAEINFEYIEKLEDCVIGKKKAGVDISRFSGPWVDECVGVAVPAKDPNPNCLPSSPAPPSDVNMTEIQAAMTELVKNKIDFIEGNGGGTNMGQALQEAVTTRKRCNAKRALFLLSDGRDNINTGRLDGMIQNLKKHEVEMFTIGIGTDVDEEQLKNAATKPIRQHYFRLQSFDDLERIREVITRNKTDFSACGVSNVQRADGFNVDTENVTEVKDERTWPWLVVIKKDGIMKCGGVLLRDNFVLTAASCLYDENKILMDSGSDERIHVSMGKFNFSDDGDSSYSQRPFVQRDPSNPIRKAMWVHDSFDINAPAANDIALIKISPVKLTAYVRTICLPDAVDSNLIQAKDLWLVGWNTSTRNPTLTLSLTPHQQVMKRAWKTDCVTSHPEMTAESLQCIGERHRPREYCSGDTGGPIVVQDKDEDDQLIYKLVGIVKDGSRCGDYNHYTVVTRITDYLDWIDRVIKGN